MMMACIGARRGSTALRTRNSSKKGVTWCSSTCSNIFKFEARQVIERMDWSNTEAEEQNILYIYKILQVDIGLFDNWAAFSLRQFPGMETRGQIGLQSLGVCRASLETFAKCILPSAEEIDGKDGTNAWN